MTDQGAYPARKSTAPPPPSTSPDDPTGLVGAANREIEKVARELVERGRQLNATVAERDQLRLDLVDAAEVNRVLTSEREELRAEVRESSETCSVLIAERNSARAVGDLHRERAAEIRTILSDAYTHGMPDPAASIVECVRWVVADWRIERASNEVDHDRNRATAAAADVDDGPFDQWAIVELMGHRRLAGRVREVQLAGHGYLRLDIPAAGDDAARTQYISPGSVYALHPTSEPTARAAAAQWRPEPVHRWELPGLAQPVDADEPDDTTPIVFTREDLVGGLD